MYVYVSISTSSLYLEYLYVSNIYLYIYIYISIHIYIYIYLYIFIVNIKTDRWVETVQTRFHSRMGMQVAFHLCSNPAGFERGSKGAV